MIIQGSKGKLSFNLLLVTLLTVLSVSLASSCPPSALRRMSLVPGRPNPNRPHRRCEYRWKGRGSKAGAGWAPTAQKYFTDVVLKPRR